MSELYGTAYRDRARPEAISATKLLGQVTFLVAIALGFLLSKVVSIFVSLLNAFSR